MPRSMAACCIQEATLGNFSQIWMPGTLVEMVPNSPRMAASASGLGSKVSIWLGPPSIHSRMHDFRLAPDTAAWAACWANRGNQPDSEAPKAPVSANCVNSRRFNFIPISFFTVDIPVRLRFSQFEFKKTPLLINAPAQIHSYSAEST